MGVRCFEDCWSKDSFSAEAVVRLPTENVSKVVSSRLTEGVYLLDRHVRENRYKAGHNYFLPSDGGDAGACCLREVVLTLSFCFF